MKRLGQSEHRTSWRRIAASTKTLQIAFAEWQAGRYRQPCSISPSVRRGAAAHGLGAGSIGTDVTLTLSIVCKSKPRPGCGAVERTRCPGGFSAFGHSRALNGPKAAWPWLGRACGRAAGREGRLHQSPRTAGLSPPACLEATDSARRGGDRAEPRADHDRTHRGGVCICTGRARSNIGLDNGLHSAQEGTSFAESRLGYPGWSAKRPKNLSKNLSIAVRVRSDRWL